jgi:hypothetical protein
MIAPRLLTRSLIGIAAAAGAAFSPAYASAANTTPTPTTPVRVSTCSGQNAEVEQATQAPNKLYPQGVIYEEWMAAGCNGIAFSRSTDGGQTWSDPIRVPGATGSTFNSWDPDVAVGSDGTVYAAYMTSNGSQWFPVVAASVDQGQTFKQPASLIPPDPKNWGDRDFLAVDPQNPQTLYLTQDYGPNRTSVTFTCASNGSCAFTTGDLNVVVWKSTDAGAHWTGPYPVNPNPNQTVTLGYFPASGGDSAPIFVEPSGKIDLVYQGYTITSTTTYSMNPAVMYYVTSTDGIHWSKPVAIDPANGTMSLYEWWIDGALAVDGAGNLYVSWDTQDQSTGADSGWLAFSGDGGAHWSSRQVPPATATPNPASVTAFAPHIMEVTAGPPGTVYVSWLSTSSPTTGTLNPYYTLNLQRFSVASGSLTPTSGIILVSGAIEGDPNTWPGDTTGISTLGSLSNVVLSWGSGVPENNQPKSEIFSSVVTFSH